MQNVQLQYYDGGLSPLARNYFGEKSYPFDYQGWFEESNLAATYIYV